MGENDNIKDVPDHDITDETHVENVADTSPEDSSGHEVIVHDTEIADNTKIVSDIIDEDKNGAEPDSVTESYETEDVAESDNAALTEPEETKDYKADLAGYRAYKKRTTRSDDAEAEETSVRIKKQKVRSAQVDSLPIFAIALAVFAALDLFVMHLFASKQSYNVSDEILSALGFDALHFTDIKYEQICLGLGYFISFILGGIIILIMLKIIAKLFECFTDFRIGKYLPAVLLGIFALIFLVGFVTSYFSNDAVLIKSVFQWGAPAAAYLGGLIFYGASKLHVGIEY